MTGRTRNIQLKFYVTEDERSLIEQKMAQLKTNRIGAYLRKMAIDGYIIFVDHTDIKKQTAEIQKIGVNINQIAKRMNMRNIYHSDINEIKEYLNKIWQLQRSILLKQR